MPCVQSSVMFKCAFVLITLLGFQIFSIQGIRQLRPADNKAGSTSTSPTHPNRLLGFDNSEHQGVAFRPTTPGNSPGVGHALVTNRVFGYPNSPPVKKEGETSQPTSLRNKFAFTKSNELAKQIRSPGDNNWHFVAGNKDDFRPTAPGHSPGVGHALSKNGEPNA